MLLLPEFECVRESLHGVSFPRINCFDDPHAASAIVLSQLVDDLPNIITFGRERKAAVSVFGDETGARERIQPLLNRRLAALNFLKNVTRTPFPVVFSKQQQDFQMLDRFNMSTKEIQ